MHGHKDNCPNVSPKRRDLRTNVGSGTSRVDPRTKARGGDGRTDTRTKVQGGDGRVDDRTKTQGGDGRNDTRAKVRGGAGRKSAGFDCECGHSLGSDRELFEHVAQCEVIHIEQSIPEVSNGIMNTAVRNMQAAVEKCCAPDVCAVCDTFMDLSPSADVKGSRVQHLLGEPPTSWMNTLQPPAGLNRLLVNQYVVALSANEVGVNVAKSWKSLMLSSHPDCIKLSNTGVPIGVHCCGDCFSSLKRSALPKFAIRSGLFMGQATAETGFADDITPQEWKLVSRVVTRFQVTKITCAKDTPEGNTSRRGIIGHSVSCEAPIEQVEQFLQKLPLTQNATLSVHVTGPLTTAQKAAAIAPVVTRQRVVSAWLYFTIRSRFDN